ncbi:hypothetical protein ACTXT7_007437 [Hymenolepis weldensis]
MDCFHRLRHHSCEIDWHLVGHNEAPTVHKAHLFQAEDAEVWSDEERVVISGVGKREMKERSAPSEVGGEVEVEVTARPLGHPAHAIHRRDPATAPRGSFWLLGFPPGPVRPSLGDLEATTL